MGGYQTKPEMFSWMEKLPRQSSKNTSVRVLHESKDDAGGIYFGF